ncbi:MAG TPA: Lrp/AsnC family transcriptional regulator [Methanospirillum sp.]|jgi:DNA-binding Lrp family transcriptional regulator|uniref:helix-turn-helix transcriptional regulator n=1 Tax=Methanospirillum sp. TaxID=45200 RepID=UPI001BD2448B|nr:Lrp/AsnC family transcriptional regulator [Methanospirillum sp.]HPY61168.1 Lrp/AsnC family transcriptional regulator [Methanospirillum sp.]
MSGTDEDAFQIIASSPEGVLQSELWKILGVDSRKCSRIVKKLLDTNRIERIEYRQEGIKTFRLIAMKGPADPYCLLAGSELIPCIACDEDCTVESCNELLDWMYQLAISDAEESFSTSEKTEA